MDIREAEIVLLKKDVQLLKQEIKELTMRLSAVKVIVHNVNPVCSQKILDLVEGCKEGGC